MGGIDDLINETVNEVCALLEYVTPQQIRSKDRSYKVATARQLVMWNLVRNCGLGYNETGKAMGKHHATIMYGVRQIDNIIELGRGYDIKICDAAMRLKEKEMNYEMMTDDELIKLFFEETCPYNKMAIARHVKDDKQRTKLLDHANYLRHKEDEGEW